ncbi:hypothetical protein ACHAQJ_001160 [Trichoderma viride]
MAPVFLNWDNGLHSLPNLLDSVLEWLAQPLIMAWAVTFTAVCTLILCLGFGPAGIGAGTIAAAFQSYMYGAFTPAGGIFATLTSMAMLGTMMPPAAILASVIATGVAMLTWMWGIGRG